jgi:phosphopentomutase
VTIAGAVEYLTTRKPRVLYVMLGDTDEWAHERRYDLYLDAAARGDRFIRTLWEMVQRMPEYRGRTALLLATDHGRGSGDDWTDHGRDVPAAGRIWMAGLLPAGGQHSVLSGSFTQSQFAATIAGMLGLEAEFRLAQPGAAAGIPVRAP